MKHFYAAGSLVVAAMFLLLSTPGSAHATCAQLGGVVNGTECQIAGPLTTSGTFDIEAPLTLHFLNSGGSITTGGADLTINVHGAMIMDANTLISADKEKGTGGACNTGGAITLNIDLAATFKVGSIIRSNSCSGGPILIVAGLQDPPGGNIDAQGLIESVGSNKNTDNPGGGTITLKTPCDLTVTGKVSSRGFDPGADLVQLVGGCIVNVFGLVESTGLGHKIPVNHCQPPERPGKPANSVGCIEIVAGLNGVVIDSVSPNNGEVNADVGGINGGPGVSWVDIFSTGPIQIKGDVASPFAVHANELSQGAGQAGTITVKSRDFSVTASGLALQADDLKQIGGTILIQAKTDIILNDAQIFARGDFVAQNGFGTGGKITANAFSGVLSWQNTAVLPDSIGDVRPTGDGVPLAQRGTIDLTACTSAPNVTGTLFPVGPGALVPPFPATSIACMVGSPTFPAYITFPVCGCQGGLCPCVQTFTHTANSPTITLNGDNMTTVTTVLLTPGTQITANCNASAGTPAHIASQTAASIVLDQLGSFAAGTYKIITVSPFGSCCTDKVVTIP